ncbi:E3 ubiquitin-protein ligase MARCHF3-like isoform X2 [Anoplolepis gracilipes]|uniref:E3 ubiquitin-protein ligase MARCHF3-like isoform X2 n=1 Tax=Anoplolepis gracilipes TaxID=354296 RepID=UPI003BA1E1BA
MTHLYCSRSTTWCKGTLAYVHLSCLERWLNQSCRTYCELCRYYFNAVETPRYRWPESLRIWISHPRNRRNIQSDLLILTLLTIVTVGLAAVCLLGPGVAMVQVVEEHRECQARCGPSIALPSTLG